MSYRGEILYLFYSLAHWDIHIKVDETFCCLSSKIQSKQRLILINNSMSRITYSKLIEAPAVFIENYLCVILLCLSIRQRVLEHPLSLCWVAEKRSPNAEESTALPCLCTCAAAGCVLMVWGMRCGWRATSQQTGGKPVVELSAETWGGGASNSWIATALSSLFALQWFSHRTCLLNQGPPSTKTDN